MSVIASMLQALEDSQHDSSGVIVTQDQFLDWMSGDAVIDSLKGLRLGQSFCNQFDIRDNILYYTSNNDQASDYIKKTYVK